MVLWELGAELPLKNQIPKSSLFLLLLVIVFTKPRITHANVISC